MSIQEKEALEILGELGAVIANSHLVYTSGRHGDAYFNKDAIYPHTEVTSRLCMAIAERFANDDVEAVIAPAIGGVILSQWVAYHLTAKTGKEVLGLYAEKGKDGSFIIARGYENIVPGKRVLVVEDVLNTGGSVEQVVAIVRELGGNVIGVGALVNRGDVTADKIGSVPKLEAILNVTLASWDAANCPLCAAGVEINTSVGKGKEFLASKK